MFYAPLEANFSYVLAANMIELARGTCRGEGCGARDTSWRVNSCACAVNKRAPGLVGKTVEDDFEEERYAGKT